LQETENQGFVLQIVANLTSTTAAANNAPVVINNADDNNNANIDNNNANVDEQENPTTSTTTAATIITNTISVDEEEQDEIEFRKRLSKIKQILVDGLDIDLMLNFLFTHSKTELTLLKEVKTSTELRGGNVLHNATVVAHAFLNAGTTKDSFLRFLYFLLLFTLCASFFYLFYYFVIINISIVKNK
jgi:26S proteasome regulatory subunit N2